MSRICIGKSDLPTAEQCRIGCSRQFAPLRRRSVRSDSNVRVLARTVAGPDRHCRYQYLDGGNWTEIGVSSYHSISRPYPNIRRAKFKKLSSIPTFATGMACSRFVGGGRCGDVIRSSFPMLKLQTRVIPLPEGLHAFRYNPGAAHAGTAITTRLASSYLHPSSVPIVEIHSNPRLIKDHLHHVNGLTQRTHKTAQDSLPLIYTVKGGCCQ
jgi:hypothetical protein